MHPNDGTSSMQIEVNHDKRCMMEARLSLAQRAS